MARRAATLDLLLALALGVGMQVELLFVDAPRRDVLIARAAVLALAVQLNRALADKAAAAEADREARAAAAVAGERARIAGELHQLVSDALTSMVAGATTAERLARASPRLAGAGHGLIGMRECVRVYGGEVPSGPRAAGGWEVSARLPLERATAGVS